MEPPPMTDKLRCTRTDGRKWRCKRRVMDNMKLCEIHYMQGRHRQYREKVPDDLKIQRHSQTAPCEDSLAGAGDIKSQIEKVDDTVTLIKRNRIESPEAAATDASPIKKAKKKKKKKKSEEKECELNLELIRLVLKKEVEKRNALRKTKTIDDVEEEEADFVRDLPYGRMTIASSSFSKCFRGNVGSNSASKLRVGAELEAPGVGNVARRCFRSKNIEPMPVGTVQVLPCGDENEARLRKSRRKRCHWCQRSGTTFTEGLIKCSSCKKHLFCLSCIRERYFDMQEEVRMSCPVCRGTCHCKECSEKQHKDAESKHYMGVKNKFEVILHFHYLVCMLFPVLKKINQDKKFELEAEAKMRGRKLSEVYIRQAEVSCSVQNSCNKCKAFIVDLHRSCSNCSYNLCLSCCRDQFHGNFRGGVNTFLSRCSYINDVWASGNGKVLKRPLSTQMQNIGYISSVASMANWKASSAVDGISYPPKESGDCTQMQNVGFISSFASVTNWKACNAVDGISCPPKESGGCGDRFLDLRCFFPVNWIKELEVSAEEIVCSYELPETSDMTLSCPLCVDTDQNVNGVQQLQEAALRDNSNDNHLFYPTLLDIHRDNVEHFQKHWSKGHPVIVRGVLPTTSELSWDPVVMFCIYLERSIARYESNKNSQEAIHTLDWCEVEMGIRQYFMGSLNGRSERNSWNETLKLKGWLSSQLFQEQFPAHYSDIIHSLPFQEYTNPASGLLNVAARMPQEIPKPDLGPCVYISYSFTEQFVQADSVIKLCSDSYDVVNILAHTSDAPISDELVSKIRKLLKKHYQILRESSKSDSEETKAKKVNGNSVLHSQHKKQVRSHDVIGEEMHLRKRIARDSGFSAATNEERARNLRECNMSFDWESDVDSEATLSCSRSINGDETSEDEESSDLHERSNGALKPCEESSAAKWDVFRRQDVPKLIEYLRRHSNELNHTYGVHKHIDHPLFDQSFFLDSIHKIRLKEEFKIEPWCFEQHIGEAVIIPAGCPYQISSPKSCVHVALDFLSPENVTQCIQLTDEVRLLPEAHKAKVDKLEVKRMALYSISSAIKEIHELTCTMQVQSCMNSCKF